ncbi:DUF1330 domain-containing protein [Ramlibacter pallidus]|uniref:DUF1330 domain-containing protein n=1 Tax=Ramlibacter pallidus TaxID=2780087 RepID=A0ABR9S5G5_9BURK|nr:DUF1330 domain-containing protein [Ramlibacter pallidus]MBE7368751.1 DUF1330 domain-containing protein [Ramlibacter pallidus]
MPAAYLIVEMNISDPDRYKEYMARAPEAVKAAGGEYLVRGGRHETLEGDWQPHRVAMLRFPSYEKAKAFYDGEMYTQARGFRNGTTEYFNMVLVEGVPAPI